MQATTAVPGTRHAHITVCIVIPITTPTSPFPCLYQSAYCNLSCAPCCIRRQQPGPSVRCSAHKCITGTQRTAVSVGYGGQRQDTGSPDATDAAAVHGTGGSPRCARAIKFIEHKTGSATCWHSYPIIGLAMLCKTIHCHTLPYSVLAMPGQYASRVYPVAVHSTCLMHPTACTQCILSVPYAPLLLPSCRLPSPPPSQHTLHGRPGSLPVHLLLLPPGVEHPPLLPSCAATLMHPHLVATCLLMAAQSTVGVATLQRYCHHAC